MTTDLFGGDPGGNPPGGTPPESPRSRSRSRGRAKEQRKRKRRRSFGVLAVAIVMVLGAGYVVVELMGGMFTGGSSTAGVQDYPGPGHGSVTVAVKPGDTGAAMARTLVDAGVVATASSFNKAFAANPDASKIQPGTYNMLLEMKASDSIVALLDPASRVSFKVTIPEGLNRDQILAKVSEKTLIPMADLMAAVADPAAIGLPAEAGGHAEGWLFPATYDVQPGATAASVLSQMTAKTVAILTAKGVPQDQWQTVLTKASIVEREGKLDADRAKVARAIENRLAKQMPLQIDATTSYGLGVVRAPTVAENNDPTNLYSTYVRVGLPPGPIASPGEVSIDAVLAPADGPWLFWVTVDPTTGETLFTDNYDEQQVNIQKLRDWQKANGQ